MAKDKKSAEEPQAEAAAEPQSPPATETTPEQPPATESAPPVAEPTVRVFEVEIPDCLLRKLRFIATDGDDALRQYKEFGGITSHVKAAIVNELPADSEGYKTTKADYDKVQAAFAAKK